MLGLIRSPQAKLRLTNKNSSVMLDEVLYGSAVDILDERSYFYLVNTLYNYRGYIRKDEIFAVKSKINHFEDYNGIITKHYVDVFCEPHDKSLVTITLPKGSYIKVLPEITDNFQMIELINHQKGFLQKDCFKLRKKPNIKDNEQAIRERVISNALSYAGAQFRYGGKTVQGIDSSGLCHISYLLEEIVIPRNTDYNNQNFRIISEAELKQGDLVCLRDHIMMYLGSNTYIHSSLTDSGVTVNTLKDKNGIIGYISVF